MQIQQDQKANVTGMSLGGKLKQLIFRIAEKRFYRQRQENAPLHGGYLFCGHFVATCVVGLINEMTGQHLDNIWSIVAALWRDS